MQDFGSGDGGSNPPGGTQILAQLCQCPVSMLPGQGITPQVPRKNPEFELFPPYLYKQPAHFLLVSRPVTPDMSGDRNRLCSSTLPGNKGALRVAARGNTFRLQRRLPSAKSQRRFEPRSIATRGAQEGRASARDNQTTRRPCVWSMASGRSGRYARAL